MRFSLFDDVLVCLSFYSRLPVRPSAGGLMPDFSRVSWAAPVAGGVIGGIGGAVVLGASFAHLPSPVVSVLGVCAVVGVTGALHEDGLADIADGFGGGDSREQKLAIMRDSRLGTYGVITLVLFTLLRVTALFAILSKGVMMAALALISAGALSRACGLLPLTILPPARADGAGASATAPDAATLSRAFVLGIGFALAPALDAGSIGSVLASILAACAGALAVTRLAGRQIGGYTGDVLGAAQQVAEVGVLLGLSV